MFRKCLFLSSFAFRRVSYFFTNSKIERMKEWEIKKNKDSSIESLKEDLYRFGSKGVQVKSRSYLHPEKTDVDSGWKKENINSNMSKRKKKISRFSLAQKVFLLSFVVFLFSAGFAFMTFYQNKNTISSNNIDLVFDHVAFVDGGDELKISIDVTNYNHAPLEFTNVLLEYPSISTLNENGIERQVLSLDTILPGETKTAEFYAVLYGEQGLQNSLNGTLEYRVEGSEATFQKKESSLVTLRSTPIDIVLKSSDQIINMQEEVYDFYVTSQSEDPLSNLVFQLDLPPGFEVTKASPSTLYGDNIWQLGTLDPLEERKISITGILHAQEGQAKTLRAYVGSGGQNGDDLGVIFNTLSKTVDIISPFLLAELYVDRSTADTISSASGRAVSGSIEWRNTLEEAIKSPEFFLFMGGGAYDKEGVEPQSGFFSSSENKIIWSKETLESLKVIEPGETGRLRFSLTPKTLSGAGFSSPDLLLRVGVRGVDSSGKLREVSQTDAMKIQMGTVVDILAESLHYTGPFQNFGRVPPRVGRSTDYTVKWTVTNSVNKVDRTRITATLPPYVEWKGSTSPSSESIRYEPTSRTVVWDLGEINKGAGFGGAGKTAYFQVAITPSLSQVGEIAELTSKVSIEGVDTYTGALISTKTRPATTRLLNDGNRVSGADGRIEE